MTLPLVRLSALVARLVCTAVLLVIAAGGVAHAQIANNYTMGAGDEIRVSVFGDEVLSG